MFGASLRRSRDCLIKGDSSERGVLAIRSPCRPNPIGITVAEILSIEGNRIKVTGLDALNGTPILDIKPYVPITDFFEVSRIGWFTGKGEWPPVEDDANSQG